MRILGIILIVAGTLALAWKGFTYEKEEKVIDLGPIQATARKQETIPIPPWVAAAGLAAGVVLVMVGGRKK
jgi:hypothetical protein